MIRPGYEIHAGQTQSQRSEEGISPRQGARCPGAGGRAHLHPGGGRPAQPDRPLAGILEAARPYDVFRKRLHPALALFWGLTVFVSSVVWQFPQYSLGTAVLKDILAVAGLSVPRLPIVLVLVVASTAVCWGYGRG